MQLNLKEEARKLRAIGMAITKIAQTLNVAKSTVSLWVRDVSLTPEQKQDLLSRPGNYSRNRDLSRSNSFRNKRIGYQNKGRQRVYLEDPLYLAGCMLYWGEGSKNKNIVKLTNSDPALLLLFKSFIEKFFHIQNDDFSFTINCYTDIHPLQDIESYWMKTLNLSSSNLRKGQTDNIPKSSKNIKNGKLEWGTVALIIYRTDIVQEIFGAIQEYASFTNKKWLD